MNCNLKLAIAGAGLVGVLALDPLSAAMKPGEYLNGQWSTVPDGDRGITFTYLKDDDGSGSLFGATFAFGPDGDDEWVTVTMNFLENQFTAGGDISAVEDGTFANPPVDGSVTDIGDASVTLNSCGSATLSFDFDEALTDIADVTWDLEPLGNQVGLPQGTQCPYEQEFTGCPDFAQSSEFLDRACVLNGRITDDIILGNETTWVLNGLVEIGGLNTNSGSVTIEPGTTLVGRGDGADFLYINPGSQIFAEGTRTAPIVMTSINDGFQEGFDPQPGDVGGLVVSGNAPCNAAAADGLCDSEFDPTLSYGGDDPFESSGVIRFMQVRFAGFEFEPNREVNAYTFQGVGNGTKVDFIQAISGLDDGVEFFGGNVNVRHFVATAGNDDGIDWDEGWSGKLQYGLVAYTDSSNGDHGIEGANNGDDFDATPRATPVLSNVTFLGAAGTGEGIRLKEGSAGQIWNSAVANFESSCIHLADEATYVAAGSPSQPSGATAFAGVVIDGASCGEPFRQDPAGTFQVSDFFAAFPGNENTGLMLDGFMPMAGSPLLTGGLRVTESLEADAAPDDFFDATTFRGAFDGINDWTTGWTKNPLGQ